MATKRVASSEVSMDELVFKTKVVFKVHKFTHLDTTIDGKSVNSDVFTIGTDEWRVSVHFQDIDGNKYVSVYINLVKTTDETIDAQFKAYILDMDCKTIGDVLLARHTISKGQTWGSKQFIQYSTLTDQMDKYLPNNTLTVGFNITVWKSIVGHKKKVCFGNSFGNKDLKLVVKGKELFASKDMLSSHSEVFESMFLNDMSEKASNEVVIDDIDADVFQEFLQFLVSGDSDQMDEMSEELLYVSDKYMVNDLKIICQNLIYLEINAKNAFKILDLMDKCLSEELKTKAIQFIKDNAFECLKYKGLADDDITNPVIKQVISGLKNEPKSKKSKQTFSFTYRV